MANETYALADAPSEDDYQAFYAVLAESARGRAFLAEHARRARQADTAMLLAAFERLEARIEAQTAAAPDEPPVAAAPESATDIDSVRKPAAIPEVMLFEARKAAAVTMAVEPDAPPAAEFAVAAQSAPPRRDTLAAVMALSEEERIALFT